MKNLVLIGSGNLATNLGLSLVSKGYTVLQVWSKQLKNAEKLAKKLNCDYTDSLNNLHGADLYIVSVKDDSINSVLNKISFDSVVHTSGSTDINIFKEKFDNYGVLYPLQTFNKNILSDFSEIPICIESNNKKYEKKLFHLANSLSKNTIKISSEQRKIIHIAAVFASNFTNHMFTIADSLLADQKIDFKLLIPLINQTIAKLNTNIAKDVQTGPAKRKDNKIIKDHLNNISNNSNKELYRLITNSIIESNE